MLGKIGLILLLLLGFGLSFIAGALAPGDLREGISGGAQRLMAVPLVASSLAAIGVQTQKPAAKPGDDAVPLKSLLVPPVLPDKAKLALRAGTFDFPEPAQQLAARFQGLDYPNEVIPVVDRYGGRSYVVAAGEYASEADALAERDTVVRRAGLTRIPVLMLLPPEKKKKAEKK